MRLSRIPLRCSSALHRKLHANRPQLNFPLFRRVFASACSALHSGVCSALHRVQGAPSASVTRPGVTGNAARFSATAKATPRYHRAGYSRFRRSPSRRPKSPRRR